MSFVIRLPEMAASSLIGLRSLILQEIFFCFPLVEISFRTILNYLSDSANEKTFPSNNNQQSWL